MKNLLNLISVRHLNKREQKSIVGGYVQPGDKCDGASGCAVNEVCCGPPGGPYECGYTACA